jgi:hypothetical protein
MGNRERTAGRQRRDHAPLLRREKQDPCADYWHTMKIGIPIAAILFLLLPFLIG